MLHVAILKEGQIKIYPSLVDRSSPGPERVQLGVEVALEAGEVGPEALRGGRHLRHLRVEAVHLQHHGSGNMGLLMQILRTD